jgi:hypothetical protein
VDVDDRHATLGVQHVFDTVLGCRQMRLALVRARLRYDGVDSIDRINSESEE